MSFRDQVLCLYPGREHLADLDERLPYVLPGPCAGEIERRLVGLRDVLDVRGLELLHVDQVGLVDEVYYRDLAHDLEEGRRPCRKVPNGLLPRAIADNQGALRALVIDRMQSSIFPLPEDIPYQQRYLDMQQAGGHFPVHLDGLLRDLRPDSGDVLVIEHVEDIPSDEGSLPYSRVP